MGSGNFPSVSDAGLFLLGAQKNTACGLQLSAVLSFGKSREADLCKPVTGEDGGTSEARNNPGNNSTPGGTPASANHVVLYPARLTSGILRILSARDLTDVVSEEPCAGVERAS